MQDLANTKGDSVLLTFIKDDLIRYCEYQKYHSKDFKCGITSEDVSSINSFIKMYHSNDASDLRDEEVGIFIKETAKNFKRIVKQLVYSRAFKNRTVYSSEKLEERKKIIDYRSFCEYYGINFSTVKNSTKVTIPPFRILNQICADYFITMETLLLSKARVIKPIDTRNKVIYKYVYKPMSKHVSDTFIDNIYKPISINKSIYSKYKDSNIDIRTMLTYIYKCNKRNFNDFLIQPTKICSDFGMPDGYTYYEFIHNLINIIRNKLDEKHRINVTEHTLCRFILYLNLYADYLNSRIDYQKYNVVNIILVKNIHDPDINNINLDTIVTDYLRHEDAYMFETNEPLVDLYELYKNNELTSCQKLIEVCRNYRHKYTEEYHIL